VGRFAKTIGQWVTFVAIVGAFVKRMLQHVRFFNDNTPIDTWT
jgi:hypothetical protein